MRKILVFVLLIVCCTTTAVKYPLLISSGSHGASELSDSVIAVLNWNVHKETDLPLLREELTSFISQSRPNFIVLQEFMLLDVVEEKLKQMNNLGWVFSPNVYSAEDNAYSGVVTMATVKPVKSKAYLSSGVEPVLRTPKIFLVTKYKIANTNYELMLINIHAINFHATNTYFKEQIMNLIYIASKHIGPVIVAGDFNTWRKSRLDFLNEQMNKNNFQEVVFGDVEDGVEAFLGNKLDHIYYSPKYLKLKEETKRILSGFESSDHNALYAEFIVDIKK